MKHMKIAFVGVGSIAKRHLGNVWEFLNGNCTIDVYRSSNRSLPEEIQKKIARQLPYNGPVEDHYDAVFVTTPTSVHYETIKKFAPHTDAFFIEKPVFDRTDYDLSAIENLSDKICYVACPLRYNSVIQYVKENIPCEEAYAVRAISSSYLPNWRPGQDYRTCYSAHKDMGGGVSIDLIHEWDYLFHLFGTPTQVKSIIDQISNLEIHSDDIAVYIAKTEKTVIELHLDYFGRKDMRQLQIFLPEDVVTCDILAGTVHYEVSGETIRLNCERNAWQMAEIVQYFRILSGEAENHNAVQNAVNILSCAMGTF